MKIKAFTLAETLIVIGIIGVVAALTLPNLNHATGDKEKVTRVKKIYSALTDAFDRAQAVYGDFDTWFKDLGQDDGYGSKHCERAAKRISEFMKVSKDCGNSKGCFSDTILLDQTGEEYTSNRDSDIIDYGGYTFILADGASIGFYRAGSSTQYIFIDTDGPNKGKNQVGNDSFTFYIRDNILKALDTCTSMTGKADFSQSTGYDIYVWALYNDNMDYFKCPDELDWEKQTSCK